MINKISIYVLLAFFMAISGESENIFNNNFGFDLDGNIHYRRQLTNWLSIGPRFNPGYFYSYQNDQNRHRMAFSQNPILFDLVSIKSSKTIFWVINNIEINWFKREDISLNQDYSLPRDPPIYLESKSFGLNLLEIKIGYLFKIDINDRVEFKPGLEFCHGYSELSQPSFYGDILPNFNIEMNIKY